MWTITFGIIAFALAIPSWGGSVIIFFWIKNKIDNMAVLQILDMAKRSAQGEGFMNLYRINNASINEVYKLFGTNIYGYSLEQYHEANRAGILRTDYHFDNNIIFPSIKHPEIGEIYLYLSQTSGNKINIFAMKPSA
jgi:hypothetical protein